ncbi:MAG: mechanosensitive ion channel domain-containing protein [Ilumatobacteraceae bacterium]
MTRSSITAATRHDRASHRLGALDEALAGEQVTGENLLAAGVVLAIGLVAAWLIGRSRRRRLDRFEDQTRQFVGLTMRIAQVQVLAVSVGWALTTLGADIGWLTVLLLALGLIVVLAARPVLEGMGASAALVTRPAFSVGDEISVDETVGEVLEITNRSTVLRLRDAGRVHIPQRPGAVEDRHDVHRRSAPAVGGGGHGGLRQRPRPRRARAA